MRRLARAGVGAGLLTGLGAVGVKAARAVRSRRQARRDRALEQRRNLWPPVPVKPGTEARIDADRVAGDPG
jgi:hypothetical protein